MFKEIGGYFELEQFGGTSYHEEGIALNSGRGCLSYLVELRKINTIWVPDFMCDSVFDRLNWDGVLVKEYPITLNFLPDYTKISCDTDEWFYLMDYYGSLKREDVEYAREFSGGRLIVDETQAYFNKPWANSDTIYTCRKWFGVSDGAYLFTKDNTVLKRELPTDYSYSRMEYLLGRFERTAGEFFLQSQNNNIFLIVSLQKKCLKSPVIF